MMAGVANHDDTASYQTLGITGHKRPLEDFMKTNKHHAALIATLLIISSGFFSANQAVAQVRSPLSTEPIRDQFLQKRQPNPDRSTLTAPGSGGSASIVVRQIQTTPTEFPPVMQNQYKVGFECSIKNPNSQAGNVKYPRYRCFLDQTRTATLNAMGIHRVDNFPSIDGITTKIIVVANKSAQNPMPGRIRSAFQLYLEKSEADSAPVLKDFVYADGLLATK